MFGKCGAIGDVEAYFRSMIFRDFMSWAAIIKAYASGGDMQDARFVFEMTPSLSVVLWNIMVTAYGRRGDIKNAKLMFDQLPEKSIVSQNSMIVAYGGHFLREAKSLFDALEIFAQMSQEGVKPNRITFISALDASSSSLRALERIHKQITECGFHADDSLSNSLIHAYGKAGRLDKARLVFDKMNSAARSVIAWNSLISAFAQRGFLQEADFLLQTMHHQGVLANEVTFIVILDGCKSLEYGKSVHELIADAGYHTYAIVATVLINFYGKFGCLPEASLVFDQVAEAERNLVLYTSLVSAYAQNGFGREAFQTFNRMDLDGFTPNKVTFVSALDGFASLSSTAGSQGRFLHAEVINFGYQADTTVANSLINMYSKCGELHRAYQIFNQMIKDVVSWNVMISGYAQNGHAQEAFDLQLRMNQEGVMPNELTFISILSACGHGGMVRDSLVRFASISGDFNMRPSADQFLCIVGILGRAGKIQEAEEVISEMPFEPDFVAWASLLAACRLGGDVERGKNAAEFGQTLFPERDVNFVLLTNVFAEAQG